MVLLSSALCKGVISACLTYCVSDVACQSLERRVLPAVPSLSAPPHDVKRTVAFVGTALLFNGPASVAIISCVDAMTFVRAPLAKAAVNMLVEPVRLGGTLMTFQLLSGRGFGAGLEIIRRELWQMYVKGVVLWMPALWFCYARLPLANRAPFLYLIGAFWDTFISYVANNPHRGRKEA